MLTNFRAKKELEKKAITSTNSQQASSGPQASSSQQSSASQQNSVSSQNPSHEQSSLRQNSAPDQTSTLAQNALSLLSEAIDGVLFNNTQRVYIDDVSFLADIKLPNGLNLQDLNKAITNKNISFLEAKVVSDEMLVHYFRLNPSTQFEVWYKPLPRPRF